MIIQCGLGTISIGVPEGNLNLQMFCDDLKKIIEDKGFENIVLTDKKIVCLQLEATRNQSQALQRLDDHLEELKGKLKVVPLLETLSTPLGTFRYQMPDNLNMAAVVERCLENLKKL